MSMSISSKRFVLSEEDAATGASSSVQPRTRRKSNLYMRSLQELDETVASAGKMYNSPRRPGDDEHSVNDSNTIISSDSHSMVYTNRHLIENMPQLGRSKRLSRQSGQRSVQSYRSSRSRRSRRSKSSRQVRGNSLERAISRTILQTAEAGVEDAHFVVSLEGDSLARDTPVDDILSDLGQTDAIIESEITSLAASRSNSPRDSKQQNLLAPLVLDDDVSRGLIHDDLTPCIQLGKSTEFLLNKRREFAVVSPVTSDETPPHEEEANAAPVQHQARPNRVSLDDPFANIDQAQDTSTLWSYSDDEATENHMTVLPVEESLVLTNTLYNVKQAAVSGTTEPSSYVEPVETLFDIDGTWTSFDNSLFPEDAFGTSAKDILLADSRASPSSIVDFGIQRRKERHLDLAFSQSTESAFSSKLSSTMAVI